MQARKEVALRNDRVTLDDVVGELIQAVQQLFVLLDY
jgi:ATP-dependent Clp protease adapter protein ClpS